MYFHFFDIATLLSRGLFALLSQFILYLAAVAAVGEKGF